MNRYFKLIEISVFIIYFSIFINALNAFKIFKIIMEGGSIGTFSMFFFILAIVYCIACFFLIIQGKKYLYNFNYFGEPVIVDEKENLTDETPYDLSDYLDVPEPYKIQIAIYFVLAVSSINLFCYLCAFLYQQIFNATNGLMNIYMNDTPLANPNAFILLALFFYSFNMHIQVKQYKKYYAQLITADKTENIDLIYELHEK